jgi:hypothetical protein
VPGGYDDDDWPATGGERLGGPIFEGGYFTSRYIRNIASEILTKYCLKPPEKLVVFEEVLGNIWLIFNRAIFGRSRHSKYRPNIASLFAARRASFRSNVLKDLKGVWSGPVVRT